MRKLKTCDIPVLCRCVKKLGLKEQIRAIAASLSDVCGKDVSPEEMAAALIEEIYAVSETLETEKAGIMAFYQKNCITLGKDIQVLRENSRRPAKAIGVTEDGALVVEFTPGVRETVNSGEISIRGMYGYV